MAREVRLIGGPYEGSHRFDDPPSGFIGLGVDELLGPDRGGRPYAIAVYERATGEEGAFFFRWYQRPGGEPFAVELIDGPCAGVIPAPQPAPCLAETLHFPLGPDRRPFDGDGLPTEVAIYGRELVGAKPCYVFRGVDDSAATLDAVIEEINDRRITEAVNQFYAEPDYGIYSVQPAGDHPQVLVEVGHRRGQVDEGIAPLIRELWRLGLDTIGSCQERPPGTPNAGRAYVGFPRLRDARRFHGLLAEAGIAADFVEKKFRIGARGPQGGEPVVSYELDAASVLFPGGEIPRIAELLRGISSLLPRVR